MTNSAFRVDDLAAANSITVSTATLFVANGNLVLPSGTTVANVAIGSGGGATVTVSNTIPATTTEGSLWLDSDTGDLSVYYGGDWAGVGTGPQGATGPAGSAGSPGTPGTAGNIGATGATGIGATGATGANGAAGTVGATGATGAPGSPGTAGAGYDVATNSTGFFALSVGNTAQRPSTPANGYMRLNSETGKVEIYYTGNWATIASLGFITATGGTITTSGNYKIHKFLTSGSFNITDAPVNATIEILLVAGGGAGGSRIGGGGGAGGLVYSASYIVGIANYLVSVGAGGSVTGSTGSNGSDSTFIGNATTLTAIGGGGGGGTDGIPGSAGGSGGGGGRWGSAVGGAAQQPTSISGGFGTAGGAGGPSNAGASNDKSGGGGGAGSAGVNGGSSSAAGGAGLEYVQFSTQGGSPAGWFAGGGGGGAYQGGAGGTGGTGGGGTGNTSDTVGSAGATNTGGGGGGGGYPTAQSGNAGGSGICIIRYRFQ